ncbi:50S ribosomal protein L34e [Candidatus Woesearchaeota archaeon]|nr:50S ribosomal protein L34e [Candidatus Woesearchaeota archaeon]
MPQPRRRSRSLIRINVKTPGGRTVTHYKHRKPKPAKCGKCGSVLKGIIRERPYKMKKVAKSKKRPTRPYGGVLCSRCLRSLFTEKARNQ